MRPYSPRQVRILNPHFPAGDITLEAAVDETGLPERELRSLLNLSPKVGHIPRRMLQMYILSRNREEEITSKTTLEWLSVRWIDLPEVSTWLKQSPEGILAQILYEEDKWGNKVAHHLCADWQYMKLFGADILNTQVLSICNTRQETAAAWAASNGNLRFIPTEMLTRNIVYNEDAYGWTLLHHAALGNCLEDIPSRYLTPSSLFANRARQRDNVTETPLLTPASKHFASIPWKRLQASQWLFGLSHLRAVSDHHKSPDLDKLINRVERLKVIKSKEAI